MQAGDRVYYLHTDKYSKQVKYAAVILSPVGQDFEIRVGRLDVFAQKIETFETTVSTDNLAPRSVPCSFEEALNSGK